MIVPLFSPQELIDLDRAAAACCTARSVVVLTGAGVSAESGVPTFRGADGLWEGHHVVEVASPEGFAADPLLVSRFYDLRRTALAACHPNAGHGALAQLETLVPAFTLVTQNVDGLHRAAGSRDPLEIHGNIWRVRCMAGCRERDDRRVPWPELPPRCACGALLRPGVVWFGEVLPADLFQRASEASLVCDLFLVIGTSAQVEPAASLARLAGVGFAGTRAGALVIEINPEATPLSARAGIVLRQPSAIALPAIVERVVARQVNA